MEADFNNDIKMPRWYLDGNSLFARYKEQRSGRQIILDYYPKIVLTDGQVQNFKGLISDKRSKTVTKGQTRDKDIDARMVAISNAVMEVFKKNDPFNLSKKQFVQLVDKQLQKKVSKYQSGILKYLEERHEEIKSSKRNDHKNLTFLIPLMEQFNPALTFEQINSVMLDRFVTFLENHPNEFSHNYICQLVNALMGWINQAYKDGDHRNDAYKGWERPVEEDVFNIFLYEEEIERIYNLKFERTGDLAYDYWNYCGFEFQPYENRNHSQWNHIKTEQEFRAFVDANASSPKLLGRIKAAITLRLKHLEDCRILFVLGCWTGLRSGNYLAINKKAIVSSDLRTLEIKTIKGGDIVSIPLHPIAREIIEKARTISERVVKKNDVFNQVLPILGKLADINEKVIYDMKRGGKVITMIEPKYMLIRSHTARRSLCSNLLIRGFPETTIMALSDHRTLKSFRKYTAQVRRNDMLKQISAHPMFA